MACGEGMVAVVRGLKDAGVAVTLLDSGRQYTLLPDPVATHPSVPRVNQCRHAASQYAVDADVSTTRRESSVQATDGRYASTYRTTHCRLTPTSPPELVTEFPPQRAELYPGHENFVIGGAGSGNSYSPGTRCSSYRGGLCWPDKGSVYAPKPSIPTDTFTSSLRKYPNISQDSSSEIVERLISFTQAKHSSLKNLRSNVSPTRTIIESDVSINLDSYSRNTTNAKYPRQYEPEVVTRSKRLQESPTRDKDKKKGVIDQENLESWRRSTFCRANDVRCLKDVSRKVRDGLRNLSQHANIKPEKLNKPRERYEPNGKVHPNSNLVNMEIQAAVRMVSREITTMPLAVPSQRTIAVPISPSPSGTGPRPERVSNDPSEMVISQVTDVIQPSTKLGKESQAAIGTIDLSDNQLKRYKGSKSQEEITMSQNEMPVFQDLYLGPCYSKFRHRSRSKIIRHDKCLMKSVRNLERVHKRVFHESRSNRMISVSKNLKSVRSYVQIGRSELTPYSISGEEYLAEILEDWLDLIPFKLEYSFDREFDKELIFYQFFECLKSFAYNPFDSHRKKRLKSDILDRLDTLPIEIKGDRGVVLASLADILINKVKHFGCTKCSMSENTSRREIRGLKVSSTFVRSAALTEGELKIFTSAELRLYLEKTFLNINRHKINDLEDDLVHCFMLFMEELNFGNYKRIRKSVMKISEDYGFSKHHAMHFSNLLINHLKESFIHTRTPTKVRSETFIVLQNIQNLKQSPKYIIHNNEVGTNYKYENNTYSLDDYTTELCRQIDEWLSTLKLQILESKETGFRQVIINDLAGDIIDRQKYLELNPTTRENSNEAELELLRYQIFKWVTKLVGEDNFVPTDHAPELMERIRGLHYSREIAQLSGNLISNIKINQSLSKIKHDSNATNTQSKAEKVSLGATGSISSKQFEVMTMSQEGTGKIAAKDFNNTVSGNQDLKAACCIDLTKSSQRVKTVEQLESEYRQFVKDWVEQVPIKTSSPEQETVVKRARVELQNSLWKIVSKLNCDPATYYNRFFYEDLLDDAIDDLLDALPQNPDMRSTRHLLKIQFIEKSISINDQIKAHEDASFKNNLVKNVITSLRTHGIIEHEHDESIKQHEDLQILKLVEEYLLYTRFKNDNKLISDVFKHKLTQEIGDFVEDLKINHARELKNVDASSYKTEIMNTLQKVPLPSERTIKEEADDALLGIEVEKWYTDLPLVPNEHSYNTYKKKRDLEMLAMKIKEIVNNIKAGDSYTAVKDEVSRFLEKTPLNEGESANISFMADELVNRLRNMEKQYTSQTIKRVVFQDLDTYEDFGKNVPFASSYIETTPENIAIENDLTSDILNQVSKFDNKGQSDDNHSLETAFNEQSRNFISEPSTYRPFSGENPTSSSYSETPNPWHSLKDCQTYMPGLNIAKSVQDHYIPYTSNVSENNQDTTLDDVENKLTEQNDYSHSSYQKDVLEKNQTQASFTDKDQRMNAYLEQPASIQFNPRAIRTSKGLMGISQDAGPSGYRQSNFENYDSPLHPSQVPHTSINTNDDRGHVTYQSAYQQTPHDRVNESFNKFSVGCQSLKSKGIEENENGSIANFDNNLGVSTNTSTGHLPDMGQPKYASTPEQSIPHLPNVNKRRPKWLISEREGVKRRISFNDMVEDDDYHCRCIERLWRRRRLKYLSSDEFNDYPPCLPFFIPYPCFL
ncbi:uncharacterized protein LOC120625000 [Pararge aegeria]|uniref:uncharacterized protein LOC120625000 n=1 Tax=Pararge aegeria TaxID=116150 RepID=UPI0019D02DAA|nr:uncharacterized protein LOC120625000 [Pararge aegeria]